MQIFVSILAAASLVLGILDVLVGSQSSSLLEQGVSILQVQSAGLADAHEQASAPDAPKDSGVVVPLAGDPETKKEALSIASMMNLGSRGEGRGGGNRSRQQPMQQQQAGNRASPLFALRDPRDLGYQALNASKWHVA